MRSPTASPHPSQAGPVGIFLGVLGAQYTAARPLAKRLACAVFILGFLSATGDGGVAGARSAAGVLVPMGLGAGVGLAASLLPLPLLAADEADARCRLGASLLVRQYGALIAAFSGIGAVAADLSATPGGGGLTHGALTPGARGEDAQPLLFADAEEADARARGNQPLYAAAIDAAGWEPAAQLRGLLRWWHSRPGGLRHRLWHMKFSRLLRILRSLRIAESRLPTGVLHSELIVVLAEPLRCGFCLRVPCC